MKRNFRLHFILGFLLVVLSVIGFKAIRDGWFVPRPSLELNGQPTLLFFTLRDACDCQMKIIRSAATQIAFWEPPEELRINILWINFDERPDLGGYFKVDRAPSLVLLDRNGEVFWMQVGPNNYEKPFDMAEVEEQVALLLAREGR